MADVVKGGAFGLLKLTDYVPYPVICGLMASISVNLFDLSIFLSTQYKASHSINLFATLSVAVIHILGQNYKFNPALTFMVIITAGLVIFYGVILAFGITMADAETHNWVFGSKTTVDHYWIYFMNENISTKNIDYQALYSVSGTKSGSNATFFHALMLHMKRAVVPSYRTIH
jgi:hypothetical protein